MSNLPFLLLVLLIAAAGPEFNSANIVTLSPIMGFLSGIILYLAALLLIYQQHFKLRASSLVKLRLANIYLITAIFIFTLLFGGGRLFGVFYSPTTLFVLALYFAGLSLFYKLNPYYGPGNNQLRLILPFTFPLIAFSVILDIFTSLESDSSFKDQYLLIAIASALFLTTLLISPALIKRLWRCESLKGPLRAELEAVCKRAHFSCQDMTNWGVLDNAFTAAIVGIIPRFRYILFTKRLLNELPLSNIKAILCHEIGHSYRKHLLLYFFIIIGMGEAVVITSFLTINPNAPPTSDYALLFLFFCYTLIMALYYRYIFGFFSRLFERQADLHVFEVGVDPIALIEALDYIGKANGNNHSAPDWRHYSIKERMDFLSAASKDSSLIAAHNRYVHTMLCIFFSCLFAIGWFIWQQGGFL